MVPGFEVLQSHPRSWINPTGQWGHGVWRGGTGSGEHSLDADALHVLGTPGIDVALGILEGLKGVMAPVFLGQGRSYSLVTLLSCGPALGAHSRVRVTGGLAKGTEEGS